MIENWSVAVTLTFAASIHCVGMCGGFVAAVAAADRRPTKLLLHQLLLQLGKASSYAFLGALAGAAGAALLANPVFSWGARVLAVVAGLAIVGAGLTLLGLGASSSAKPGLLGSAWQRAMRPLLDTKPPGYSLVVGMLIGFLPCPLVYAGLGGAAASGSALKGAVILAGVALGTVPALLLVAAFGSAVPLAWRRGLARAAGVLLIAVGLVTGSRGLGLHSGHAHHGGTTTPAAATPEPACPEHAAHTGH